MPSDDQKRMDALSGAIARLLRRLDEDERRLGRIERQLGIAPPETPPQPAAEPSLPQPAEAPPGKQPAVAPAPLPTPEPGRPRVFETRMGLTLINRVAVVTCILAAVFFFNYAVDNDWIGETGRVVLGVLAGFLTLGVAERVWRGGQKIYSQGLCGLGAAVLYVSFYTAFGFYDLLPQSFVFILMVLTTAMTAVLAFRYDGVAIAVLALLGGYATPALLSTGEDRPWFVFSYVVILNLGALAISRYRRWRILEVEAFLATWFLYAAWICTAWTGIPLSAEHRLPAAFFALLFYALFATTNWRGVVFISQFLASLLVAAAWTEHPAPYFLSMIALSIAGLAIAGRRGWPGAAIVAFAACGLSAAVYGLDRAVIPLWGSLVFLTAAFLLFSGWTPWRVLVRKAPVRPSELVLLVLNAGGYFGACYYLLEADYKAYLGLFAVVLAAGHLILGRLIWRLQPEERRDARPVLLSLGVALILLTLAAPIQFSGFRITMAWALEAAALAWISVRAGSIHLARVSVAVFALVLCRLLAVDSWIYSAPDAFSAIANQRFLTFAIAAVSLWGAAFWTRRGWPSSQWISLAAYVAGHFTMLWVLSLEVLGWAGRSAAAENLRNVESTSLSILIAGYAVLLIGLGVLTRSAIDRILGLSLIVIVVGKLYLYDVWQLRRIYRVVAFAGLGTLLLATSYLYSRFRGSIENWWKDESSGP